MGDSAPAIEVVGLRKEYGETIAVVRADRQQRWGYVCLSRDGQGAYRSTRMAEGFVTRDIATRALYTLASHLD